MMMMKVLEPNKLGKHFTCDYRGLAMCISIMNAPVVKSSLKVLQ